MNIASAYPSKYLRASDLPEEGSLAVTIETIRMEEIGRDKQTKPVLYFEETGVGLIVNITNARVIARLLGSEEFDDWIGKTVKLYRTDVSFQGEMVESIRVRSRPEKPKAKERTPVAAVKKAATEPEVEVDEDSGIPF